MQEKYKQLELLVAQAAARLQTLQRQAVADRQKIRLQQDTIARLKEHEAELKALREWKKNTLGTLKKLEARLDKEITKARQQQDSFI